MRDSAARSQNGLCVVSHVMAEASVVTRINRRSARMPLLKQVVFLGAGGAAHNLKNSYHCPQHQQERPATTILTSPDGVYYFNRSASPAHCPFSACVLCSPPKTDEHKPRNSSATDSDTGRPGTVIRRHTNHPIRPPQGSTSTTLARGRRRQCDAPDNPHH